MTPEARAVKRARAQHVRQKLRPLNWYVSNPMFNHAVCDDLGVEADDRRDSGLSESGLVAAYHTFTDGSLIRGQGAGWAFSIFAKSDAPGQLKPLLTAAGPIVTLRTSGGP